MNGDICVIKQLLERLQGIKTPTTGDVYGLVEPGNGDVTLLAVTTQCQPPLPHDPSLLLPPSLELVGEFVRLPDETKQQNGPSKSSHKHSLLVTVSQTTVTVKRRAPGTSQFHAVPYKVVSQEQLQRSVLACRSRVCVDLGSRDKTADVKAAVARCTSSLEAAAVFVLQGTGLVLTGVAKEVEEEDGGVLAYGGCFVNSEQTIGEALEELPSKHGYQPLESLVFDMMIDNSGGKSTEAPVVKVSNEQVKVQRTLLVGECVAYMHKCTPIEVVGSILVKSVLQYIKLTEHWLIKLITEAKINGNLETVTVLPHKAGHLFTLLYPCVTQEDDLREYRKTLSQTFLLPPNCPFMRKLNAYEFSSDKKSYHLYNTHIGLKDPDVEGLMSVVQGLYSYHHYMQDAFNDNHWGCAYRSLQTIISWFRHQGYTSKPVPTHRQIQQCLVSIGDKPSKFLGSTEWIGSTEVGFVLESYLGVTSRFISVSSGSELSDKGRELVHHFNTQGTPIMIGGGVLAHTILGVAWNPQSGDISYLVLDPHYTGQEDLGSIQRGGWCGWKGPAFWSAKAYYNLCLPQRSDIV